jgi:hypothetical protein
MQKYSFDSDHIHLDDRDREDLWNVGFELNIDTADRPRRFNIELPPIFIPFVSNRNIL